MCSFALDGILNNYVAMYYDMIYLYIDAPQ